MDIRFLDGCAYPEAVGPLFQEYTDMLLSENPAFSKYLQLQHYAEELVHLENKYGPPGGRLYLLETPVGEAVGTGAITRVLITTSDGTARWGTVGVSENIIEASWNALVDSIEYGLARREQQLR